MKADNKKYGCVVYVEGTDAEQIGVSPSTVHRRREKIIKKLKNYLK